MTTAEIIRARADEVQELNIADLISLAGCYISGGPGEAGWSFLTDLASGYAAALEERAEGGEAVDEELLDDLAYSADPMSRVESLEDVPSATRERWQAFVDLTAWHEDVSDEVRDLSDLTAVAGAALRRIGKRLLSGLHEETAERLGVAAR